MTTASRLRDSFKKAQSEGWIGRHDTSVIFYDYNILQDRLQSLQSAFPSNALHAIAIKVNPLVDVLRFIRKEGYCCEAASMGEILLAREAGFSPDQIVFDSPVKTPEEIATLKNDFRGIRVNADSLDELKRYENDQGEIKLGLRINPEIASKTHSYLNVSDKRSKFGELISNRTDIIEKAIHTPSLDCLHIHQGSQLEDLTLPVNGIRMVVDLANEINDKADEQKIQFIDIGGGMPVNYGDDEWYDIATYANMIKDTCPELFDGTYTIITEFGRYIHAHAGFIASRVEYVKQRNPNDIILCHSGADIFLRECYNRGHWPHKTHLLDSTGNIKQGATATYDIAGPLCFGGDFPAYDVELPNAEEGDWLIFEDCGANTFALWSRHCSREFPKAIISNAYSIFDIKHMESQSNLSKFWK